MEQQEEGAPSSSADEQEVQLCWFGVIDTLCAANASSNVLHWRENKNTRARPESFIRTGIPKATVERPIVRNRTYHGIAKDSAHSICRHSALKDVENTVTLHEARQRATAPTRWTLADHDGGPPHRFVAAPSDSHGITSRLGLGSPRHSGEHVRRRRKR